jgi:hypothetical protein
MQNLNVGTGQEKDQYEARSLLELERILLESFQQTCSLSLFIIFLRFL